MNNPIKIIDRNIIKNIYKPILNNTHKGLQGHALIIGGSYGKIGSVVLSSKACLKTGAGLVTSFIPKCGYDIMQISIPEVMVITDKEFEFISDIKIDIKPKAIGIGMGMGLTLTTLKCFHTFLTQNTVPLVIDADGINILAKNNDCIPLLVKNTILTPHLKELERLIGPWEFEEEKLVKTIDFCRKHQTIIVIKGAPTIIVTPDYLYQNTTGNQGLATAGSGDTLTGIITSFLAQGYNAEEAAILGVYLHGLTATLATPKTGYESFIASDIIKNIGKAFLVIQEY